MHDSVLGYLWAVTRHRTAQLAAAWRERDRGASAVELAVITAIILIATLALLKVITTFVHSEAGKIHG